MIIKDIVTIAVLAIILGFAITYIIKSKKQGVKCIGCPHAKECSSKGKTCCEDK